MSREPFEPSYCFELFEPSAPFEPAVQTVQSLDCARGPRRRRGLLN